jgi:iron complex transport system permease protein
VPTGYRIGLWLGLLGAVMVAAVLISLLVGEVPISPADAWRAVLSRFGIETDAPFEAIFWSIRVPRVMAAVLVGAALGAAGATIQGVYRNPMADPYLLGVSSAAGLGAALAISLTPTGTPAFVSIAVGAGAGAILALATRRVNRATVDPTRFILVGLTLGISLFAWTVILVFVQDSPRLPTFTYFVFGSLGGITWAALWSAIALAAVGLVIAMVFLRELDLLAMGEREAGHLGVPVVRVVSVVLLGAGIAVGASVGLAGVIGFVGLLGPFVARLLVGPAHRHLVLASALTGAIFVVVADVIARWLAGSVEIPIGIVTAAIGGPLLAWLLTRRRSVT